MSTDFSIRPVGAPVAIPVLPAVGDAARNGVATQLPPSQSVTASNAGGRISSDLSNASQFVSHDAFFDTAAASIVFQSVNGLTGEVVQQYPDDATLRRRAYFHSLDQGEALPRPLQTDLKA